VPDTQWVVIAYLLAITTLIVGAGRMGDLFGRRRILLSGIGIFTFASIVCAISPTLWTLVAARTLQGAGAALMMALTIASVADLLPREQTGRAMGLLGTVSAVGTALGPSLGGLMIAWSGWPAIFAAVATIGAVTLVLGWHVFERSAQVEAAPNAEFDVPGFLLLTIALAAYAMSLTTTSSAIPLLVLAAAALALFVVVELRSPSPLIAIGKLRDRVLSGKLVALALMTAIVMATLSVGPFYLIGTAGLNAAMAGFVMSTGPVVSALAGIPAGRLIDRWGSRRTALMGLGATTVGCILMAALPAIAGVPGYVAALVPITGGYALFQASNNTAVMKAAPAEQRGVFSALLGLSRNLGLITGASAMGAVFASTSAGLPWLALPAGGLTGLQATFTAAAILAATGYGLTLIGTDDPS
jgi:MFS family permease